MASYDSAPLLPDTELTVYCLKGAISAGLGYPDTYLGTWEEGEYSFLFFLQAADSFVRAILEADERLEWVDRVVLTYGEWQGGVVEPLKIGRFLLNPPWITKTPAGGEVALRFDPGLVFGNGMHPTTRTCMTAIEIACQGGAVQSMLDLGTGTGLLALVAAQCGCSRVIAVDNNLLAARTARNNVRLNGLDDRIFVINGCAAAFARVPTDLLVANIHYEAMRRILQSPGFLEQKWFVLSGLQHREAEAILETLQALPVLILKRWTEDALWQTIMGITEPGGG